MGRSYSYPPLLEKSINKRKTGFNPFSLHVRLFTIDRLFITHFYILKRTYYFILNSLYFDMQETSTYLRYSFMMLQF